jgi:protein-disulfide isomerase
VVCKIKGEVVSRKWLVFATAAVILAAFGVGVFVFKERTNREAAQALQKSGDALVRAHSPVFGNAQAKVTIVEFFDPACEACRAFYPVVKSIVNASFGQVRLVVRYAPLHQGSAEAVKILEAAQLQGKYWQALEKTLADQPRWASHHNPQPQLIWEAIADVGLDLAKAKADAGSPAITQLLQQDVADMNALKVTRTPGFFVNGTPLRDFGEAQLKTLVQQEIAKAKSP